MASSTRPLEGKTAIVTGSSKENGIGGATAVGLAEQGANIVVHYNSSAEPAKRMVEKLQGLGVKAVAVQADAASEDFGKTLVSATLEAFKTEVIDIIVNCAGTATMHAGIEAVEYAAWDPVFRANVYAPFSLIQASLPHMKAGGRIINVGSVVAKMGNQRLVVYGASKAALTAMSVAMAEELGPLGITINTIAPGPIATDMSMEGSPIAEKLRANQHIKREGLPKEVASAIIWLAGPLASYITGQLIPVDGGIDWP